MFYHGQNAYASNNNEVTVQPVVVREPLLFGRVWTAIRDAANSNGINVRLYKYQTTELRAHRSNPFALDHKMGALDRHEDKLTAGRPDRWPGAHGGSLEKSSDGATDLNGTNMSCSLLHLAQVRVGTVGTPLSLVAQVVVARSSAASADSLPLLRFLSVLSVATVSLFGAVLMGVYARLGVLNTDFLSYAWLGHEENWATKVAVNVLFPL
jgi:hypothetical protein